MSFHSPKLRLVRRGDDAVEPAAANALEEAQLLAAVRASGFAIDEIEYLLRHHFSPASSLVPAEDAIAQAHFGWSPLGTAAESFDKPPLGD